MRLRNISLLVLVLLAFTSPSWAIGIAGSAGGKRVTVSVDGTWHGTYAAGTTYVIGDIVTDGTTNYRSLQNSNTGHTPASSPLYWQAILTKGDTGPTGATGSQGPTGAAGADGKTVLTTSGAPASGTGVNGDYAYDPATYTMYGPKAAGAWPAGTIIKGADGAGFTGGSDGTYGWLTDSNTSTYSECASGKYGLNFVGGVLYQCSNGTNSVFTSGGGTWGITTAPTYSDQTCTAGQYAFDSGYAYFCRTANTWDRIALAGWSNPSPVAPTFSSFTIDAAGTGLTVALSASTTVGSGGSGGLALACSTAGAVAATYGSGSPGTSYAYTLSPAVYSGDTCTAAYTQPGNGLEGTTGGADVVTFSGSSVTNNSTQSDYLVYWSGSNTTIDYPGGITATAAGAATITSGGPNGNYLDLSNASQWPSNNTYTIPVTSSLIDPTTAGKIKLNFYYTDTTDTVNIFSTPDIWTMRGVVGSGNVSFCYGNGGTCVSTPVTANTWHTLVVDWVHGSTFGITLDGGTRVFSTPSGTTSTISTFVFGATSSYNVNYIDEVYFYAN